MAHHSSDDPPFGKRQDQFRKIMEKEQVAELAQSLYGPTGRYPEGRMNERDEGEIQFGVTAHDGKVLVDFGTPVRSIGMTPEQACELGRLLITRAGSLGWFGRLVVSAHNAFSGSPS